MAGKKEEQEVTLENASREQLVAVVEELQQRVINANQNQQGLVAQNNELREQANAAVAKSGKLIYSKMLDLKADIDAIDKGQTNTIQGWKFRGIDDMLNNLKPLFDKHRIGVLVNTVQASEPKFTTNEKTKKITKCSNLVMKYTFFAEDGSTVDSTVPAECVDNGDKGTAKGLSAAFKYCLIQNFIVPTKDMEEGDRDVVSFGKAAEASSKAEKAPAKGEAKAADSAAPVASKEAPAVAKPRSKRVAKKATKKVAKKKSFRKNAVANGAAPADSGGL